MNRPYKLIHRLSNIMFVPTVMLIMAGVVKCSETSNHSAHESFAVTAHDVPELQSVQTDTNRSNEISENHRGKILADNITR